MTIKYVSTRGDAPDLTFEDVLLTGLASDGGLYVPENLPQLDMSEMRGLSYVETAKKVMGVFLRGVVSDQELAKIIEDSYAGFNHQDIAPLVHLQDDIYILEQFHGPTLAFKDFALQFLGRIFDAVLEKQQKHITIVGATSGDTGSAAIEGCRGRDNMDIFILHPAGRVSDVQRRQMTTVQDQNVHNIAIKGSFDDCQDLVKKMFGDHAFRQKIRMSAVNSINWARIMAQIVYYIYASTRLSDKYDGISFSVPTGNFGNIYAGYLARKMGAPIHRLIVATNRNDILYRFLQTGEMRAEDVVPSLSPSMDIQISSNFERLLFDLYGRDAQRVKKAMSDFRGAGTFIMNPEELDQMKRIFDAYRCDDQMTENIIQSTYDVFRYMLDPHSATGVYAAEKYASSSKGEGVICMATAHPSKFPVAVKKATGVHPDLPSHLSDLFERAERYDTLDNNIDVVKNYILNRID